MSDYRNRIVGYCTKPASQFLANPLNHRTMMKMWKGYLNILIKYYNLEL